MHLAASLSQHPRPDRHNQTSFLGHRDELSWCNQAKTGSLPSDERLEAAQATIFQRHDRLIVNQHFAAVGSLAQIVF